MNVNTAQTQKIDLSNICEGCLGAERQLALIRDDETRSLFSDLFKDFDHLTTVISLCWECRNILKRIILFRNKVRDAQFQLVNGVVKKTLSTLVLTTTEILDTTEQTTQHVVRQHIVRQQNVDTQLAFIKIEEVNDDDYYEAEGIASDDCKVDLKKDLTQNIAKTKCERRRKTTEDFNDSDDEPLKKNTEVKKKERKTDRGKKPGPRREKPSGVVSNERVANKLRQMNVPDQLDMVILSWEEVEEERQKALSSDVFTRLDYKCYDCAIGFNHNIKLDNHLKKHHPSAGDVVCHVCAVRFSQQRALRAHLRRHRLRWRCRLCGAAWSRVQSAADHFAREHGAPLPVHTCSFCGHRESTLSKLRLHMKDHWEREKCDLCGKTFRDKTSLRTHLFIHRGVKDYACPHCEKRFLFKKAMQIHMVTHDAPAHLYCLQCDVTFKNKISYYHHMKYNLKHIDPAKLKYSCPLCNKKFLKASRLDEHNLAVHLKATPVQCTIEGCRFACSTRTVLRNHLRTVHRNGKATRNHVCDTCGKAYTTKKSLEGHIRSHTGERPFKCNLCPSTFGYDAALYNHNKLVHLKAKRGRAKPPSPAHAWTSTEPPAPAANHK